MRKLSRYKEVLFVLFLFGIILGLNANIKIAHAEELTEPLIDCRKFEMVEFAEIRDVSKNVSSIEIPLS